MLKKLRRRNGKGKRGVQRNAVYEKVLSKARQMPSWRLAVDAHKAHVLAYAIAHKIVHACGFYANQHVPGPIGDHVRDHLVTQSEHALAFADWCSETSDRERLRAIEAAAQELGIDVDVEDLARYTARRSATRAGR